MSDISNAHVEAAYARWAPFYDRVFTAIMRPGRKAAAAAVNRVGGRVLDVGVGTGLELPMFASNLRIVGVDLSAPMLEIARGRVAQEGLTQVEDLRVMDAMALEFSDASFDVAVAPYVITTVPDPVRALDEMARVTKPGGEIVLVNHVGAESGPVAAIERWLGRHATSLGWRPEFPFAIIGDWIAARPHARLIERRTLAPLGLFTLTRIGRQG